MRYTLLGGGGFPTLEPDDRAGRVSEESAGVSVDYSGRLEQGRERSPSVQMLDALATALRLDADGRAHLFALIYNRTFDVRSAPGQELIVYDADPNTPSADALTLLGTIAASVSISEAIPSDAG